jgi:hypothetical protein
MTLLHIDGCVDREGMFAGSEKAPDEQSLFCNGRRRFVMEQLSVF